MSKKKDKGFLNKAEKFLRNKVKEVVNFKTPEKPQHGVKVVKPKLNNEAPLLLKPDGNGGTYQTPNPKYDGPYKYRRNYNGKVELINPPRPKADLKGAARNLRGPGRSLLNKSLGPAATAVETGIEIKEGGDPLITAGRNLTGMITGSLSAAGANVLAAEPAYLGGSFVTMSAYGQGEEAGRNFYDSTLKRFGIDPNKQRRPKESGEKVSINGVTYDTGYHAQELEALRANTTAQLSKTPPKPLTGDEKTEVPAADDPPTPPAPPAPPVPPTPEELNTGERQNAAGIKQQGRTLSSSDMSSMGLMDGGRFWEESGPAAGDAPPKKSVGGMYGNRARNAARAAFLDTPGSMAGYRAMQRASGIDINAGANIGGVNYQWQDGLSTQDKRAAMHAWTGGVNNTKAGTDEFAQQFLKNYTANDGTSLSGVPEEAFVASQNRPSLSGVPEEEFIAQQGGSVGKQRGTRFHPAMSQEQFIDFQREVPEASQQIRFY